MIAAELCAGRIEDGAVLTLENTPDKWSAGDVIAVQRQGAFITELTALDGSGEFCWSASPWTDLHIRLERIDDKQSRIWLRPHHRELLSLMKVGGYP